MAELDADTQRILNASLAKEAAIVIWLTSLFSRLGTNMSDQFLMHGMPGVRSAITNMDEELRTGLSERMLETIVLIWLLQLNIFGIDGNTANKANSIRSMNMLLAEAEALRHQLFMSGTTGNQINDLLNDPEVRNLSTEEKARKIREKMNEPATKSRAGMVAVGIAGVGGSIGQLGAAGDSERVPGAEILLKDWIDVGDSFVRFTHIGVVGPIPLKEKFRVGASLMDAPHDPSAPIEETANCRCKLRFSKAKP